MAEKRRVLFHGEASFLATGFSTYWNEVVKRLHAEGEFEIAEIGAYAADDDPRCDAVPWKLYPLRPNDDAGLAAYNSSHANQYGALRFNDIALDFRPDICCTILDHWMSRFILDPGDPSIPGSFPFRPYFHFAWMPTVDGAPQQDIWIDEYRHVDNILCYSQFGNDLLRKQSGGRIDPVSNASPCADTDVFKPVADKAAHRSAFGIDKDCLIVGTVMRNQPRKLYYDLIEAFSMWLRRLLASGRSDIAKKAYLYLHTSYPDFGYDIGKAVREFGIGSRVLMTYHCSPLIKINDMPGCGHSFVSLFAGERTTCRRCGRQNAQPPSADAHVSRETLAKIFNLFDVYVQYSCSEGWGMPVIEAKSCGVPVMAVDYSAMEDHANSPGGIPIRVERFFYESLRETEQRRALPDNGDLCDKLTSFFRMSPEKRAKLGREARDHVTEPVPTYGQDELMPRFSWDRTARIWRNVIRESPLRDHSETWLNPKPRLVKPELNMPRQDFSNADFVRWVVSKVWCRPDMARSVMAGQWIQWLNIGHIMDPRRGRSPIDRDAVVRYFLNKVTEHNNWETTRVERLKRKDADRLHYKVL